MGNLLCVPKSPKGKGTQRVPKKRSLKKRLFQRNKVENLIEKEDNKSDTQKSSGISNLKVIEASDAYCKDTSTTDGKTETQPRKYHIDLVLSSSILLRPFDEEQEDTTGRTRASDESGDVSRIGEDSISSTEHQQEPENITDDEKELEEPDDVTSITEVNTSATKEPLLESDSGSNKGLDDQSGKSDDVIVASIPNLSVTDESLFKEMPENETDGEQSEKPDGFEETNIPVTVEPLFQEKPDYKTDGEQHSEEYDDDFSVKKGHISNTDPSLKKDYNQTDKLSLTGTHSCPAIRKTT